MDFRTQIVQLKRPIEFDGARVESITFSEPNMDAIEAIEALGLDKLPVVMKDGAPVKDEAGDPVRENPPIAMMRAIMATLSGKPHALFGRLHPLDFRACGEAVNPLLSSQAEEVDAADSNGGTQSPPT